LPSALVHSALKRLDVIRTKPELRENLWNITNKLRGGLKELGYNVLPSESPVTPILTQGSTDLCQAIMKKLREEYGIFVSGVAYPVVPKGVVLLRLIPTAAHKEEHIDKTLAAFAAIKDFVESESETLVPS
jgi:glycine C-acetyltransferase